MEADMGYETIILEKRDSMGIITLNRPQRLNAWTPLMGAELADAFRAVDRDPSVRVAVLTGSGRGFCAGADMEFFAGQIAAGGGTAAEAGPQAPGPSRVEEF